jgi:hypothetical protein
LELSEDDEFRWWWAGLPDFVKPTYPFDLPPDRMGFAQFIFTSCGAPERCPQGGCRRTGECEGRDGPACYRADRLALSRVLLAAWLKLTQEKPDVEALRALPPPYRWPFHQDDPAPLRGTARRRRR